MFSTRAGSDLTSKHWTRLERLAREKHSSLLSPFVNYGQKVLQHWPQQAIYHLTDVYVKPFSITKDITGNQVSISPTIYEHLLCQNPFAKKLQTQIVST
jgi:hypothetical protein